MYQHKVAETTQILTNRKLKKINRILFRRGVLQFDQHFKRILFVAHINQRQGSSETSRRDSKQVLELRDAHVTG